MPGPSLPENRVTLQLMINRVAGPARFLGGVWIGIIILAIAFFVAILVDDRGLPESRIWLAVTGILGFATFVIPAYVQSSQRLAKFLIGPLGDDYRPLIAQLAMLRDGELSAYTHRGMKVDRDVFRSAVALLLYSERPTDRSLVVGRWFTHHVAEITVEISEQCDPPAPPTASQQSEQSNDLLPDEMVPAVDAQPTTTIPSAANDSHRGKKHWLASISKADFRQKRDSLTGRWEPPYNANVKTMLDLAYTFYRLFPYATVTAAKDVILRKFKQRHLVPSLKGKLSDDWIDKMLGSGTSHPYHRVRRHFLGEFDYYAADHGDQIGTGL